MIKINTRALMLGTILALAAAGRATFATSLCISAPGKVCANSQAPHGGTVRLVPRQAVAASCSVPGIWSTLYGQTTVNADLTGSFVAPYCPAPFSLTVTLAPPAAFSVRAIWSGDPEVCQSFTEEMAFTSSDCDMATGTFVNDDGSSGPDTWTEIGCVNGGSNGEPCATKISLARRDLLTVVATGMPAGGSFSYQSKLQSGVTAATIGYATGVSAQDNPNTATLADPENPSPTGSPSPGGLLNVTATYATSATATASKSFQVPTFGVSCYVNALETDWGSPPDNCGSVRYKGKVFRGIMINPLGLVGTYCRAFILELEIQGSGITADGRKVQYSRDNNIISVVNKIVGRDLTPLVPGRTLARDPKIIPQKGVLVDVDQLGQGLLANDAGGMITDYRLDVFGGAGSAACANYPNIMSVSACDPGSSTCPASTLN